MEIRTIRYFLTVAGTGSVSAASRALHVAQPSLSRQIRQLETSLGCELFARHRGRLHISPAGARLLPVARDLVTRHDQAVAMMRTLAEGREPCLTAASTVTTINDVLAPLAAVSRHAVLNLREVPTAAVVDTVSSGQADLGFSSHPGATDLEVRLVVRFPVFAQVPAGHPWAGRSTVPLADLVQERLIVPTRAYSARRVFDEHLSRMSGPLGRQSVQEMDLPRAAQALAARGQGVAVVADEPHYGLLPLVITGPAPGERVDLPLFALWNGTHYAAELIGRCVTEVRDFCVRTFPDASVA
ncbi:LysR family transcriptional regulator [Streptomyces rimosus]|uniref:LysR family transcriptional regulator n=1 Tax=Streptomyces rimosus TaxID=1927 RepID=UPI0004C524A0|nr:LysR family transcriptional regulator [Streptomyces rimosus]